MREPIKAREYSSDCIAATKLLEIFVSTGYACLKTTSFEMPNKPPTATVVASSKKGLIACFKASACKISSASIDTIYGYSETLIPAFTESALFPPILFANQFNRNASYFITINRLYRFTRDLKTNWMGYK